MTPMPDRQHEHEPLSPAGLARRSAMLEALRAEVPRAAAARRARRRAVRTVAVLALAGVVTLLVLPRRAAPPSQIGVAPPPQPGWSVVSTDPTAASRLTVRSRTDWSGVVVGDDELLLELEEMGRPAGLIRTGGKVFVSGLTLDHTGS